MAIFKDRHYTGFVQIHNSFSRRTDLSALAKVIMINLLSHPCDWKFTPESLTRECKESITAVRRALNELIKAGHIERIEKRKANGQFEYEFNAYETPRPENNHSSTSEPEEKKPPVKKDPVQYPDSDLPLTENPQPVSEMPIPILYNKKRDIKKDEKRESEKTDHAEMQAFGRYKNISLTLEEYNKLVKTYGKDQTNRSIEIASEYGHMYNRRYCYARIDKWIRDDIENLKQNQEKKKTNGYKAHHDDDFDVDMYKRFVNDFDSINAELEEQIRRRKEKNERKGVTL